MRDVREHLSHISVFLDLTGIHIPDAATMSHGNGKEGGREGHLLESQMDSKLLLGRLLVAVGGSFSGHPFDTLLRSRMVGEYL